VSARRGIRTTAALVGLLALIATPAAAQLEQVDAGAGFIFESYSFDDAATAGLESLSLLSFPFAASYPLLSSLDLSLTGAVARGSLSRPGGDEFSLTGLTDTRIGAVWRWQDRVTVSGAFYLPTGASELTLDQARVAGAVSSLLLPFRVTAWGIGGGADVSVAVAHRLNEEVGLGVRLGYRALNEYEPLETSLGAGAAYDPGDQIYLRLAADRNMGAGKGTVSLTYQNIGEDASGGQNIFSAGDRIQLLGSYVFPFLGWGSGYGYAGVLHRTEGEFLTTSQLDPTAAQTLWLAGAGARARVRGVLFKPSVDIRALRTGDGLSQGYTLGVGGQAEFERNALLFAPMVRIRFGNLMVREDAESAFTGFQLGLMVRRGGTR
jgi:hypothetical protein